MSAADRSCPCGTGLSYAQCCGRYLRGEALPATPEQLMRSRYTAFVEGDVDYLLATWHPATRPPRLELQAGTKWLGLKIRRSSIAGPEDTEGVVEFIARFRAGGASATRLHEASRFVREEGRWYYVDGRMADRG